MVKYIFECFLLKKWVGQINSFIKHIIIYLIKLYKKKTTNKSSTIELENILKKSKFKNVSLKATKIKKLKIPPPTGSPTSTLCQLHLNYKIKFLINKCLSLF